MMENEKITVQTSVAADLQKAWNCYTGPEHIVQWNFADPSWHCPQASNDLRVGGRYHARMEAKDGSYGFDFEAVYTDLQPMAQFTYEFGGRRATVLFQAHDDQTEVSVTFDPETENALELQRDGWQAILENYRSYTEASSSEENPEHAPANQPNAQETTKQRLQFSQDIKAEAMQVYESMLGLRDPGTYQQWTSAFNPTSTYEGTWEVGTKIYFVGFDENGKKGGMVSKVLAHQPAHFVSILHYGFFDGDLEITSGEQVEKWAGGIENYTFEEKNGHTTVTVDIDVVPDYLDFFKQTYPLALKKLQEICE